MLGKPAGLPFNCSFYEFAIDRVVATGGDHNLETSWLERSQATSRPFPAPVYPGADSKEFQNDSESTSPLMAGVSSMAAEAYQRANSWGSQVFGVPSVSTSEVQNPGNFF